MTPHENGRLIFRFFTDDLRTKPGYQDKTRSLLRLLCDKQHSKNGSGGWTLVIRELTIQEKNFPNNIEYLVKQPQDGRTPLPYITKTGRKEKTVLTESGGVRHGITKKTLGGNRNMFSLHVTVLLKKSESLMV